MTALHGGRVDKPGDLPQPVGGCRPGRGGAGTALVGSHEEVANLIDEYHSVGFDEFILSGYPHLEEAYWFAEGVLPLLNTKASPDSSGPRAGRIRAGFHLLMPQRYSWVWTIGSMQPVRRLCAMDHLLVVADGPSTWMFGAICAVISAFILGISAGPGWARLLEVVTIVFFIGVTIAGMIIGAEDRDWMDTYATTLSGGVLAAMALGSLAFGPFTQQYAPA